MQVLGLIPARLGSTEVKRKNVRPLAGRPLVEYTFDAALESRLDRVILSTEAEEIAALGRESGVDVPFLRPAELAETAATAISVVAHALEFLEREEGWVPDAVSYLQPTSPFRTAQHIDEALALMTATSKNSVVSMTRPHQHPAYMFVAGENESLTDLLDPELYRAERRQDLMPVFSINDATILSRTAHLSQATRDQGLITDFSSFQPHFVDPPATIDINTEQDFLFADFLIHRQKNMET